MKINENEVSVILGNDLDLKTKLFRKLVRAEFNAPSEFISNVATEHKSLNMQRAILFLSKTKDIFIDVNDKSFDFGDSFTARPDAFFDQSLIMIDVPYDLRNSKDCKFKNISEKRFNKIQMQLLATNKNCAYYVQYIAPKGDPFDPENYVPEQINSEFISRDPEWFESNKHHFDIFFNRLALELENPEHLEPLRLIIDSDESAELLKQIDELKLRQKTDSASEKKLLAELIKMANESDAEIHGRKLTKVIKKGSVTAAALIKFHGTTNEQQDKLRGKESVSWRLS